VHGTFVAGILFAKRGSGAPGICPNCTLLVRSIFSESAPANGGMPSARPEELAAAVVESVSAGVRVINLSAALSHSSTDGESTLAAAFDHAAQRGVVVIAAAGNQGTVGSSPITGHPWVIPVISCDLTGRPTPESNLCGSIGRGGLAAPGIDIASIGSVGGPYTLSGTSAAAPFVTGTTALLWSVFPNATPSQMKLALLRANGRGRRTIAPPLLDAWAAYSALSLN
jgi:subtilisin family serine protease